MWQSMSPLLFNQTGSKHKGHFKLVLMQDEKKWRFFFVYYLRIPILFTRKWYDFLHTTVRKVSECYWPYSRVLLKKGLLFFSMYNRTFGPMTDFWFIYVLYSSFQNECTPHEKLIFPGAIGKKFYIFYIMHLKQSSKTWHGISDFICYPPTIFVYQ